MLPLLSNTYVEYIHVQITVKHPKKRSLQGLDNEVVETDPNTESYEEPLKVGNLVACYT